jgi:subtilisin family serine protease
MKRRCVAAILTCGLALSSAAALRAQVSLPPVQVPNLPPVAGALEETLERPLNRLDPKLLRTLRETRLRTLLRENRDTIEADPTGAPMLRRQVLAFDPTPAALTRALEAGFTVARRSVLEGLDASLVVLWVPQGVSTRKALAQLRKLDPEGSYDYNHIYLESGLASETPVPARTLPVAEPAPATAAPARPPVRIGLIDTGVETTHPVFRATRLTMHGCDGKPVAGAHGTAVASLLAGEAQEFRGAAPRAVLYAADVYCGLPSGGSIDAILDALAWMARERVPVINISLVGPPNKLLEGVTRTLLGRGHTLVAAVGNDGPAAKPLFPASYPGVVGVTAVDAKSRVLLEACRGEQVDFAAPGSGIAAASGNGTFAEVRGTSFAAPIIAALLALHPRALDRQASDDAIRDLAAGATDLGRKGRDDTYGSGLVGQSLRPQLAAALPNKSNGHK